MNNTVVVKFNNTSLRLSHSRIDKINNSPDKKTALQMSLIKKIQYICMNKGKKLSDFYDFIHNNKNGKILFIESNGRIQEKIKSVINEKMPSLKTVKIDNSENIEKKLQKILKEKGMDLKNDIFTEIVYYENNEDITGKTYYLSKNHPLIYKPNIPYVHPKYEQGASKYIVSKDNNFVALATIGKEKFSPENEFYDLEGLNSIKIGLAVTPNLMISHNAGICLVDHLNNNPPLSQRVFENAVNDLKQLHKRHVFLRDIKPGNMAYDGKQVNFIDVDDRIKLKRGNYSTLGPTFNIYGKEVIYTPKYITLGLVNRIYTSDPANSEKSILRELGITCYHQVADEYAFLMTMIASTTKSKDLNFAIHNAKTDIAGDFILNEISDKIKNCNDERKLKNLEEEYIKTKNTYIHPGVMNKSNEKYFTSWLEENIKPDHYKSVKSLLTDPAKYAYKVPKTHLADMLLFK